MKWRLSIIVVSLCVGFATGCTTGKPITREASIHHSWPQPNANRKNTSLEDSDVEASNHINARPGYHIFRDPKSNQTYRVLYFVDLSWSGKKIAVPNNPVPSPERWLTQSAELKLTAKSFRFDEVGAQDWVDGPPIQLALVSSTSSGAYLRFSAECLFYVDAENPLYPKAYRGRKIRLPIDFTIFDDEKVVVNGYDYPKNDLDPNVSFDHWEIPFHEMTLRFSNGTAAFDGSSPGYTEHWELTEDGWVQTERE